MVKLAVLVPLGILGIFVGLQLLSAIQNGLGALSQTAQGILLVSIGLIAWAGRRYLMHDRARREREAELALTAATTVVVAPEPVALPTPPPVVGNRERWGAQFLEEIFTPASPEVAAEPTEVAGEDIWLDDDEDVYDEIDEETAQVVAVLGQVTEMLAAVAGHIDENREQMRVLRKVLADSSTPASQPIDCDISLPDQERREQAQTNGHAEVLCREKNGWMSGVEIIDQICDQGGVRYWLRRKSDGYIFPRAFDANDVRIESDAVGSGSSV